MIIILFIIVFNHKKRENFGILDTIDSELDNLELRLPSAEHLTAIKQLGDLVKTVYDSNSLTLDEIIIGDKTINASYLSGLEDKYTTTEMSNNFHNKTYINNNYYNKDYINTELDKKANIDSPVFTGTTTFDNLVVSGGKILPKSGTFKKFTKVGGADGYFMNEIGQCTPKNEVRQFSSSNNTDAKCITACKNQDGCNYAMRSGSNCYQKPSSYFDKYGNCKSGYYRDGNYRNFYVP